jgi:glycosyltransferase involved in cell wall biosynthesis
VRTTVVIPTYDEAGNIADLLRLVREHLPAAHVIVVDDESPDGTAAVAQQVADELGQIEVLHRQGKQGLGAAYRAGFARALEHGSQICVQMDADLSHDPAVLPALVSVVEHGADAAIGSRYVPGGVIEDWPRLRRWLSRWGNRYAAGMLGLAVNDATSGYRAYSGSALERLGYESVTAEGYGFQVEMTHRLVRCGGRIVEIPITFRDRMRGESKLTHHIISEAFGLVNRLWWNDRVRRRRHRTG